ncbi:uncharacterized protein V1518DRAFT_391142 [Limtongia smithiae]|uniref:uncharacterized protein n=1 Tax=Limtongia smithiae TaxID=1125753 RepID=UPI0034CEC97F
MSSSTRSAGRTHRKHTQSRQHIPPANVGVHAPVQPHVQVQHGMQHHVDKRYIRRPLERNIPSKIEALIPEAKLYRDLRDVEQNMDATISRKRLDIEDMLAEGAKERRKLRLTISNSAIDQPWQTVDHIDQNAFDFNIGTIPSWILRIEGKLLDDNMNPDTQHHREFTSFFHSIAVELDRPKDLYPDSNVIVWNFQTKGGIATGATSPHADFVDVKRKGDTNVHARISFYQATSPERYKLSAALSQVLGGMRELTRQGIVMGLWQYVKFHKLQDPDDKRVINLNDDLREIFGLGLRMPFAHMIDLVTPHLLPLDPVVVNYTICIEKDNQPLELTYDIDVEVDSSTRHTLQNVLANWNSNQEELQLLDDVIGQRIQELTTAKLRRDFFTQMAHEPADFINRWIGSQARDLEIVLGDRELQSEDVRRAGFYLSEDLKESIFLLLNKK